MAELGGIGSSAGADPRLGVARVARVAAADADGGTSFAETLKRALGEVSALQDRAQDAIGAFVTGQPVELHDVMAAAEEAGIALEMLIEIRNKLTEAYRTVMQMQT
ncbi:MAG: flagellar hook-basal body complex protein FliE [Gemmatimonadetes bacterium]|nr:MAG: flagellar hook-basal body complex protein FliE [Gemmatimonadota bacterium]